MQTDRTAFLQAIRHDPDADAPRLIYADWLDDFGEPDLAAFIRHSCFAADDTHSMLERLADHRKGATAFRRVAAAWRRNYPGCEQVTGYRGSITPGRIASAGYAETIRRFAERELVDGLRVELAQRDLWPRGSAECFPSLIVEAYSLSDASDQLDRIGTGNLRRLTIDLLEREFSPSIPNVVTPLDRLESLTIRGNFWRPVEGEAGRFAARLTALKELRISSWDSSERTLPDFLNGLPVPTLEVLSSDNSPGAAQVNQIMAWPGAADVGEFGFALRHTDAVRAYFATPWLARFCDAPGFVAGHLEPRSAFDTDFIPPAEWAVNLRELAPQPDVCWCSSGKGDAAFLSLLTPSAKVIHASFRTAVPADSPLRDSVPAMRPERVQLGGPGWDAELIRSWLIGPNGTGSAIDWSDCRSLKMSGTGISKKVLSAIADCPTMTGLDVLYLDCDYLSADALAPVLACPRLANTCVSVQTELVLPPSLFARYPQLDAGPRAKLPASRAARLGGYSV